MALQRMESLKDKLETKALLENELVKVEDKIDEMVGEKKAKISKKKK
jgi:hypothetical protein